MTHNITKETLANAYDFERYSKFVDALVAARKTSGDDQSEALIDFTKLNLQRMKRLSKTTRLTGELQEILSQTKKNVIWLVLTEAWCGDAAQSVPVLAKIAEASEAIQLQLILRDEHLEIMDKFLTDGGRSIPKLIALDPISLEVQYTWGPRPQEAQGLMLKLKGEGKDHDELVEQIQNWYNKDKTRSIQKEIAELLR